MTFTLIVIGILIAFSFLSFVLILTALRLSSQGGYWVEGLGQELIPARETETIGELQGETVSAETAPAA